MTPTTFDLSLDAWQADGCPTRIEYARAVMEELRLAAMEGLNRIPHGGVEIGGVLFGYRDQDSVTILAHRPLACEYAFGPTFKLSDNDGRAMRDLQLAPGTDRELSGMQAVGWYHSHTRSGIQLSEIALQIFDSYFPEPWQIALVLRPQILKPTRGGFFFREPDGTIRAQSTRREFVIRAPGGKQPAKLTDGDAAVQPESGVAAPAAMDAPTLAFPADPEPTVGMDMPMRSFTADPEPIAAMDMPMPSFTADPESIALRDSREEHSARGLGNRTLLIRWAGATAIALVLVVLLFWMTRPDRGLSLRALDTGGQLRIDWNCNSRVIQGSDGGLLEIEDGARKVHYELSREQLGAGSVTYMRNTSIVLVRLLVRGADQRTRSEVTRFLSLPAEGREVAEAKQVNRSGERDRTEAGSRPNELVEAAPVIGRADEESGRPAVTVSVEMAIPEEKPAVSHRARRTLAAPSTSVPRAPEPLPPPPPTMAVVNAPAIAAEIPHLPSPPSPTVAAYPKAGYQGPSSGRIIWTGKLGRRGTLQIVESRASQGHITGSLPGVPVRVHVLPAELTSQGLQLFVADPKSVGATEAPGVQNAWNRTVYVHSPKQAGEISVLEAPGPENAWNRLVVRAERGEHSIIVLAWELSADSGSHAGGGRLF